MARDTWQVGAEDPQRPDVQALVARHLAFAWSTSPPENVHALDPERLGAEGVHLVGLRQDGKLLAIGALKQLSDRHAELKSMHTAEQARGRGAARAVLGHLLALAWQRGYERISLETGSMERFAPARALYASAGFVECGPFEGYEPSEYSTFMTLETPVQRG